MVRQRQVYDENTERRAYIYNWCDAYSFRNDDEVAVASAYQASLMREKAYFMKPARRAEFLGELKDAFPVEHPLVQEHLRDGFTAFHNRVLDRIWREYGDRFNILRCPQCSRILKSPHARQCIWCGANWHDSAA